MLLRIIGRFCCSSLQKAWTVEFKETLEGLADEDNETVRDVNTSFEHFFHLFMVKFK